MLRLAVVVMLVDLLESTSVARALARKNGYVLSYNQEVVALGLANFAGALFSSYTTTGSFSRSAVNNSSGAKTQLAGFITAMVVMFVLLVMTPVFSLLPYNTMAAIIIAGVSTLVEFDTAAHLFKTQLRDFIVWLVAFLCTLLLGVELGLAMAVGLAILIVVFESAFPHTAVLGRVDRTTVYRNIQQYPSAEMVPGVLVVRLDAPVYFANVQWMEDKLVQYEVDALRFAQANGVDKVEYVVLDLTPVPHMDSMGCAFLEDMHEDYKKRGMQLILTNPSPRVIRILERFGFINNIGREWIFVCVHDAVVNCQHNLMQLEAGGNLPTYQPMAEYSSGAGADGGNSGGIDVHAAARSLPDAAGQSC
jgi:sulfate transporter 4